MGRYGNDVQDLYLDIIIGFIGIVIVFIGMFETDTITSVIFLITGVFTSSVAAVYFGLMGFNESISRRFSKNGKL